MTLGHFGAPNVLPLSRVRPYRTRLRDATRRAVRAAEAAGQRTAARRLLRRVRRPDVWRTERTFHHELFAQSVEFAVLRRPAAVRVLRDRTGDAPLEADRWERSFLPGRDSLLLIHRLPERNLPRALHRLATFCRFSRAVEILRCLHSRRIELLESLNCCSFE